VFHRLLEKYFLGEGDDKTLSLLGLAQNGEQAGGGHG
jgi:hypothetical protein